ncbi:MAG: sigma-70 family RNA polymerase sigma factor [Phycisphaerae bacterium]|nr:sigma-70 family RNA polymerase sigma factor [Phycisphaerae bacterium]
MPDTPLDRNDGLFAEVYNQLRHIAQRKLAMERKDHTLQPTALVNEAWMRLQGANGPENVTNRAHFFATAAQAMRRILIEHARARGAIKRGGGARPARFNDLIDLARDENLSNALVLDDLISRLEQEDARAASVVCMRFFAGLSHEETAEALGVSVGTVKNDWNFARAWLKAQWEASPNDSADSQ